MLNAPYSQLQSEGTGNGPPSAKTVRYMVAELIGEQTASARDAV